MTDPLPICPNGQAGSTACVKRARTLRVAAIALMLLAAAAAAGAYFALHFELVNHTLMSDCGDTVSRSLRWNDAEMLLCIGAFLLDAILCVLAARLWRKANDERPCVAGNEFLRVLCDQAGVIVALFCCPPVGFVLLVLSKGMGKKAKTVLLAFVVMLLLSPVVSALDFGQPNSEAIERMLRDATADGTFDTACWTRYRGTFHLDPTCQKIGGAFTEGSLRDAFDANRWDPCDLCAPRLQTALDEETEAMNNPTADEG